MIDLNYPWKYKELANWKFNHQELIDYYEEIKKNFQHRKWSMDVIEPCEYQYIQKKMHGYECWSIQTRYKDPTKPCGIFRGDQAPWEVLDGDTYDGATEMVFGFAKKLIDKVPGIYQMGLSCHNPGFEIAQHQDFDKITNLPIFKIHLPVYTTPECDWLFGDQLVHFEEKKAYMFNANCSHGTVNKSNTFRVHLLMLIRPQHIQHALEANIDLT